MIREVQFSDGVHAKLKAGINKLANAVKATLGPKGRNVVLDQQWSPAVTKDGVTVAKNIFLEDPYENIGASLVREVASKTNDMAGDGTTTATILAQALYNEGYKMIAAGFNPVTIKKGIEYASKEIVSNLKKQATQITTEGEDIERVASISANDPALGKTIAELVKKVGKEGIITVEEGNSSEIETDIVQGMRLDSGFLSPYMITNPDKVSAELDDPYILITDKKIVSISDVLPIMERINTTGKKQLFIICEGIEGEALSTLILNKLNGVFTTVAVKAPKFGLLKKDILGDVAVLTGGTYIGEEMGLKLENVTIPQLGKAKKVIVTRDTVTFVKGAGKQKDVDARVDGIKGTLAGKTEAFDAAMLYERLAKLKGGIGVIKVGAATATAMREIKQRVEDAINATKAAIEEGIVPGGGLALIHASVGVFLPDSDERSTGMKVMLEAVKEPMRTIAYNAGKDPSVILEKIDAHKNLSDIQHYGYNAATDTFEDLVAAGIIDPVKVTRSALENATSIASLLLTTEAVVADKYDPREANRPGGPAR